MELNENNFAEEVMREIRRARIQSNIRSGVFVAAIALLTGFNLYQSYFSSEAKGIPRGKDYVSLVRVEGAIKPNTSTSAHALKTPLERAFMDEKSKGVILSINSPGGSPVQSSNVYKLLNRFKEKYDKPLVVVGEDQMASGGYMIAVAADRIYVNETTIGGSIGVVQQALGYGELAERIGIEERVFTAGEHKRRLSAFEPVTDEDANKMARELKKIHRYFISLVKEGREGKLVGQDKDIFEGDFFSGLELVELGLADGIGNVDLVAEDYFSVEHIMDYTPRKGVFSKLSGTFAGQLSSALVQDIAIFIKSGTLQPNL